jgi:hypothetical protein
MRLLPTTELEHHLVVAGADDDVAEHRVMIGAF